MKIERINEWFGLYADKILKKRWWILATFVLVIVLSVVGMKRMVKETSFDDYFIEDDPMLVKTEEIHCSTVHHNIKVAGRYDQPPAKLNKYYMNYCLCLQCWGDVGNPCIDA